VKPADTDQVPASQQPPPAPAGLRIDRRPNDDGAVRLVLSGELDVVACPSLRAEIDDALSACTRVDIVLDQLEYIDSSGIGELLRAVERAASQGRGLTISPGTGNVYRILTVSGMAGVLLGER
jgi:anti-sigma B factor antagonist